MKFSNYASGYEDFNNWIGTANSLFILKIKGESMIKKNINNGDYVVINKQNIANIGDVVDVDIEGNATLKTYKTRGVRYFLCLEMMIMSL